MKKLLALLLIASFGGLWGCSDDPEKEEAKIDPVKTYEQLKTEANTSMETVFASMSQANVTDPVQLGNFDFDSPRKLFEELKSQRPDDRDVRVSLAMCQMLSLYRDPVFKVFLIQLNENGVFRVQNSDIPLSLGFVLFNIGSVLSQEMMINSMSLMIRKGAKNPDDVVLLQTYFLTKIIPQISQSIENFEFVEKSTGFEYQYALTGKMMGFPALPSQYMDNTEFYLMDAYLEYLRSILSMYCMIDFKNSDFTGVDVDSLPPFDPKNPDITPYLFVTQKVKLRSDGLVNGRVFVNGQLNSTRDIISSLLYLQSEYDNQQDDVIKKNPELSNQKIFELILTAQAGLARLEELLGPVLAMLLTYRP